MKVTYESYIDLKVTPDSYI